jgi:hypothetical protein
MCIKKKRRVQYRVFNYGLYEEDKKDKVRPIKNWGYEFKMGWFVDYGLGIVENEKGSTSYTVAIVENDNMRVELVDVSNIEFIP